MQLILNNKTYTIPARLTVDQWTELMKWDFTDVSHWARAVSIVTGAPYDVLKYAPQEALELGASLLVELINQRAETTMKPLDELKFGEWIDLDIYISMGVTTNLKKMIKILNSETEWADEALWIADKYIQWRSTVYRQYSNLFGLDEQVEDGEEPEIQDPLHTARSWYAIIVDLADNNLLNLDAITEQPLVKTLNFMALRKQKQLEENMKILQQQKKYDLQRNR